MKKFLFLFFVLAILILHWIFSPYYLTEDKDEKEQTEIPTKIDSTVTVTFSVVGDIMCHSTQYNYARVKKDSFNFKPVFSVIGNYLRKKDILMGNFETVLAGSTHSYLGYPFFNTPNEFAGALEYAGFDFLFTANNHANDQGLEGIERTIDVLENFNIIPVGTRKKNEPEKTKIFVKNNLKFGLLAYTYGTNYNEKLLNPKKFINHINYKTIKADIDSLKNKKPDLIIVYFHFGKEYEKKPTPFQKKVVNKTIGYGADIILASHPHVVQKFVKFKTVNANLDSGFVTYSLGNFLSNQRWRYSDGGLIFNFSITKNIFTGSVFVSDIGYLPIWVFKGEVNGKKEYIILPSEDYTDSVKYSYLTKTDIDSMKKSFYDNVNLFTGGKNNLKIDKLKD